MKRAVISVLAVTLLAALFTFIYIFKRNDAQVVLATSSTQKTAKVLTKAPTVITHLPTHQATSVFSLPKLVGSRLFLGILVTSIVVATIIVTVTLLVVFYFKSHSLDAVNRAAEEEAERIRKVAEEEAEKQRKDEEAQKALQAKRTAAIVARVLFPILCPIFFIVGFYVLLPLHHAVMGVEAEEFVKKLTVFSVVQVVATLLFLLFVEPTAVAMGVLMTLAVSIPLVSSNVSLIKKFSFDVDKFGVAVFTVLTLATVLCGVVVPIV
jgi:uncharacterized membrane protein